MMGRVSAMELDEQGLGAAVDAVREGRCVVLPTDTVYGIGADPFSELAVQGLLDAKRRGRDMPPPVLIAERTMLRALVAAVPEAAKKLADAFWPGPLTLILRAQSGGGLHLGEAGDTVALRVPAHDGARELLRRTGPLAVSSANISGEPPATTAAEAESQLGDSVAVYLDGGPTPGLVPSTIVDFSVREEGVVVRVGVVSLETLREVAPTVVLLDEEAPAVEEASDEVTAAPEADEADAAASPEDASEPVAGDDSQPQEQPAADGDA